MEFNSRERLAQEDLQNWFANRTSFTNEEAVEILETVIKLTGFRSDQLGFAHEDINREKLNRWMRTHINIKQGTATVIESSEYRPWLLDKRASIEWKFWERYREFLLKDKLRNPKTIDEIESSADQALDRLGDPTIVEYSSDHRGLIVGEIQSGKTQHYVGLINRALDVGYKTIVVLAGRTNALRTQTQIRIDEGVLGRDTSTLSTEDDYKPEVSGAYGVGKRGILPIIPGTHAREDGEFKKSVAQHFVDAGSETPRILVVKKHVSVLDNVINALTRFANDDPNRGIRVDREHPLLVIDDEADDASVNVNDDESRPSRTNELVRKLLHSFERASYLGYTATPFANIFIRPDGELDGLGKDLFPRDFIIRIPEPSNHFGPKALFGFSALDLPSMSEEIESVSPMPLVRNVVDEIDFVHPKHKIDHEPGPLPESLKAAIHSFFLAQAARVARGQHKEHHSMLVHVTRFVKVQGLVFEQVKEFCQELRRSMQFDAPSTLAMFKVLWDADFQPTTLNLRSSHPSFRAECEPLEWHEVEPHIVNAISRTDVLQVNGYATEALNYKQHDELGYSVILIGGDKLSRGLTLEGLSVAYYLRDSRTYDTLLQMGRWFGYRPGYLDLCRIYAQPRVVRNFKYVVQATEELKLEFDEMRLQRRTPADFGLRVQNHPGQLMVTGYGKRRSAEIQRLDPYSGKDVLNPRAALRSDILGNNYQAVEDLIGSLPSEYEDRVGDLLWRDVPSPLIVQYLESLQIEDEESGQTRMQWSSFAEFIQKASEIGELTSWTVLLANNTSANRQEHIIAGHKIGLGMRANSAADIDKDQIFEARQGNPTYPNHRDADLTDEARARAFDLQSKRDASKLPNISASIIREVRKPENALLILYPMALTGVPKTGSVPILWSVGMPNNLNVEQTEYQVNMVWQDGQFA